MSPLCYLKRKAIVHLEIDVKVGSTFHPSLPYGHKYDMCPLSSLVAAILGGTACNENSLWGRGGSGWPWGLVVSPGCLTIPV